MPRKWSNAETDTILDLYLSGISLKVPVQRMKLLAAVDRTEKAIRIYLDRLGYRDVRVEDYAPTANRLVWPRDKPFETNHFRLITLATSLRGRRNGAAQVEWLQTLFGCSPEKIKLELQQLDSQLMLPLYRSQGPRPYETNPWWQGIHAAASRKVKRS